MSPSVERYRVLVNGQVPHAIVQLMDDRFGQAARVTPGRRSTVIDLEGDQARLRALLSLLWDVGHQVSSVSRHVETAEPHDATGTSS